MTSEPLHSDAMPSILIVDDTLDNLNLLTEMLLKRGYEPRPVSSGKLALKAAYIDPPDLILLDIQMPGMNGFEVCEALKADKVLRDIPVIFLTGLNELEDKVKAFSLGAVDFVNKPFQVEEVLIRIHTHLKICSLQRQLSFQNENLEKLVGERTRELAKANERLLDLGRLKDDFMLMISHELRTPASGLLGCGQLMLELSSPEVYQEYLPLFNASKLRLVNLLDDLTMIGNIESLIKGSGPTISFFELLDKIRGTIPALQIFMNPQSSMQPIFLHGEPALLQRALETIIHLGISFSHAKNSVRLMCEETEKAIWLRLYLDSLSVASENVGDFFKMESPVRASSEAESLGLAPIVASKIIAAFGGELKLIKAEGQTGYLEAFLAKAIEA
ncbi:MAG: response regulator [Candidatus Riflebacteria bacterium]|nr:response regulator [Candidatus Riflebacteria bacterium]